MIHSDVTTPSQLRESRLEHLLSRRPRLLFLAYFFPPANASGCVRTWNIAKHLTTLGWDVTIVTPKPSVWRYVEKSAETGTHLESEVIRRISTDHHWRCLAPESLRCWDQHLGRLVGGICRNVARHFGVDSRIGWIKAAERACSTLDTSDVDVILASGHPFAAFTLARRLANRFGRPYVLDYRDPWTENPHHLAHRVRPAIAREEAELLATCAAVTIVSPSWGVAMDRRFGLGPKLHILTNGYDPEELAGVKPYDFGHFAIVYTGNFYPPKRSIAPVMAALRRLCDTTGSRSGEWFFHYYGTHNEHVREEAERSGVLDRIRLHGWVPRADSLSAVRGAGVAVVITSVAEEITLADKGIIPAKVFEALGLGTPSLLIAPPDSDAAALAETTGLVRSFAGHDIDGITAFLQEALTGRTPASKHPEAYAWTHLGGKFDDILRGVVLSSIPK